ncbi:MAG: hypothetical protein ACJAXJ_003027 [Colwellia sp.]|jgi:hypothetical protein
MFNSISRSDLIIILGLLLCTKFIFVPIYEWQLQTMSENEFKLKKLNKSNFAINNLEQLSVDLTNMQHKKDSLQSLLFDYAAENVFQLKQQQWLESLFSEKNITLTNVGWQVQVPINNWDMIQHQVKVSFSGKATDVQELHVLLESQSEWVEIIEFNHRFGRKRAEKLGEISGYMTLRFYMRAS